MTAFDPFDRTDARNYGVGRNFDGPVQTSKMPRGWQQPVVDGNSMGSRPDVGNQSYTGQMPLNLDVNTQQPMYGYSQPSYSGNGASAAGSAMALVGLFLRVVLGWIWAPMRGDFSQVPKKVAAGMFLRCLGQTVSFLVLVAALPWALLTGSLWAIVVVAAIGFPIFGWFRFSWIAAPFIAHSRWHDAREARKNTTASLEVFPHPAAPHPVPTQRPGRY